MRTVFDIFRRDGKRLLRNPVALIITLGVCVLPALYAWYSIAAMWNPYGNTAGIEVAVANEDRGAELAPVGTFNVGSQVVEELRKNDQLGWRFVPEDEAVEGVKAGTYYAAIVIPEDFSEQLAGAATGAAESPKLQYYVNEKKSSVAPKITDAGVQAVERQINDQFVEAVSKAVVTRAQGVGHQAEDALDQAEGGLLARIGEARDTLCQVQGTVDGLGTALEDARTASGDARRALDGLSGQLPELRTALEGSSSLLRETRDAANGYATALSSALVQASVLIGTASSQANAAIGAAAGDILEIQGTIDGAIAQAGQVIAANDALIADLEADPDVPREVVDQLQSQNEQLRATAESLRATGEATRQTVEAMEQASAAINDEVQKAAAAVEQGQQAFSTSILPQLSRGLDDLAAASGALSGAVGALESSAGQARAALDQLDVTLDQAGQALATAGASIGAVQGRLDATVSDLAALNSSNSLSELSQLLGVNAGDVASFMASPAKLTSKVIYPVSTYGSGVAPFYTNLALWVGAIILVTIYRLRVSEDGIGAITPLQAYFGRGLLFAVLAVVQAVVVCVGDLVIGIQCENPVAFVGAGIVASLVFLSLVYALASSLKHIGKAIAVVLLIMQIPGSSGMYPVQMMSGFFQAVGPFLPFTYGIDAMRETIGGMYGLDYFADLGMLLLFLVPAFLIGVAARPYLLNINLLFDRKLAATGVMVGERVGRDDRRFRLRTAVRALLDSQAYRELLMQRAARFFQRYPRLIRGGLAALAVLPLAMLAVMALLRVDANGKTVALGLWVLLVIGIAAYLIVVEYIHENLKFQVGLSIAGGDDLPGTIREQLAVQAAAKGGEGEAATGDAARPGSELPGNDTAPPAHGNDAAPPAPGKDGRP